jgi:hypothetical protein
MPAEDLAALAAALDVAFEARFQQRNYAMRGGPRVSASRSSRTNGNRKLSVTDHLLAARLRSHLGLPVQAVGALLGVTGSAVSHATALAAGVLAASRVALPDAPPPGTPLRTLAALTAYAAAAGAPLAIPENGQTTPATSKTSRNQTSRDTPTPNK